LAAPLGAPQRWLEPDPPAWHAGDDVVVAYSSLMPFVIERETLTKKQGRGLVDHVPAT
jgi:hypothetical protein